MQTPEQVQAEWTRVLAEIFLEQERLMTKYKPIEQLPDWPVPLHVWRGQRLMKDFAWRAHEELVEAFESCAVHGGSREAMFEELSDALHFYVEMLIFAGMTARHCAAFGYPPPRDSEIQPSLEESFWAVSYRLGLAMHELRLKPWKRTPTPTDEGAFRRLLVMAFAEFLQMLADLGLKPNDVGRYYFAKHEINRTRIQENY